MNHKILITGASGLVGNRLTDILLKKGYQVVHLGRRKKEGTVPSFIWNVENKFIDTNSLAGVDTIIHLAGAGIADKRWTENRKREILESRTHSTQLLFETLKNENHTVKNFIGASAIGYYGFGLNDEVFTEESTVGQGFLAEVTNAWEKQTDYISSLGIRLVKLRIGIVLSEKGGALAEMAKPARYGLGAPLGSGKQFLSWIHIDDLCELFAMAVEKEVMKGPYNAVTDWVTNEELTTAIGVTLKKSFGLFRVPGFVMKVILGEMADMVLNGSKVSPAKIRQEGFQFKFPTLKKALSNLLSNSSI
jgi:uncharacterized protein